MQCMAVILVFAVEGNTSAQFKATSPDLALNGGLYTEKFRNGHNLGIEILKYPDILWFSVRKSFWIPQGPSTLIVGT